MMRKIAAVPRPIINGYSERRNAGKLFRFLRCDCITPSTLPMTIPDLTNAMQFNHILLVSVLADRHLRSRLSNRCEDLLSARRQYLALLQICDQVSDSIWLSNVHEDDLSSIRCRGRELHASNPDESSNPMFCHVDASDIFHTNLVAAFDDQPGSGLDFSVRHYIKLACSTDVNVSNNEDRDRHWSKQRRS